MFDACLPFGPCTTSKVTFWPSLRVLNPFIWMAEKCANRSSPPSSGVMNPKPFASLNHLTVPVAIPTSPVTHVTTTSPRKARRPRNAAAPSSQAHHRHFFDLWLSEKSASLIVGALYSSVKKILRCRCRVANRRFPGFFPLPLCAVAQAGRLEKSHNRLTCLARGRPPRPGSGKRRQPAQAGCAILDPIAVQHGRAASVDRGRLRNRLVEFRMRGGSSPIRR